MFIYIFGITTLLFVIHIFLNYNERARVIKKIPGPRDDFIIGNTLVGICSPVQLMKLAERLASTFNGIYRLWLWPYAVVIIYNPEDIETVLSNIKYSDKSVIYDILKPWLGDGLLISSGAKWQERRKILTPTFHFNILRQFYEIIKENSQRLVEKLKHITGEPTDVVPVCSTFTLNTICETAMGTQLNKDVLVSSKSYKNAIYELGHIFVQRFVRIYLYPDFIFYSTPLGKLQTEHVKTVHSFTSTVIKERKEYNKINEGIINDNQFDESDETYMNKRKKKTAMLDLLISAEKEGLIDDIGVQEEVDTFMFEGHDTTASGLSTFLMILANHKNIQNKIFEEINAIMERTDRSIKMEDLAKMQYLECCIKESLRLYPPVHFISRSIKEPLKLSNYTIPSGTICHISIRDLHHRADLYENPQKFDPDRFLPENCMRRHPYAYIPFSAGPRNCIGQKFAMMEMKVTVAEILRKFELLPVTRPEDIQLKADLVLRNNGPILVNFKKRK